MKITVHLGAHRCATTSFQEYMRRNATRLAEQGIGYWGPETTRLTYRQVLKAMQGDALAGFRQDLERCGQQGIRHLLICEENLIGIMQQNLNTARLYPEARQRAQIIADALAGYQVQAALSIRALNTYWASVAGYARRNPKNFYPKVRWRKLAQHPRGWREVITDVATAFPQRPVLILPFEEFAGRPDAQLAALLGVRVEDAGADLWLNGETCSTAKHGFDTGHAFELAAKFSDDLTWLADGADGLARLCLLEDITGVAATFVQDGTDKRTST